MTLTLMVETLPCPPPPFGAEAPAKASQEDSAASANLQAWCAEMKASGLSDAEIEEHMAQRLRAVRNSMLELQQLRSVGGN